MISPRKPPRSDVYQFRKAVPVALQGAVAELLGKPGTRHHELIWTLGTKDLAEAKRLMPASMERADGILLAAKQGAKPLTHREMNALAGLWYRRQLALWERDPSAHSIWEGWLDIVDEQDGSTRLPSGFVDDLLSEERVVTGPDSRAELAALLGTRLYQALHRQQKISSGDYSPDPRPRTFPAWEPSSVPVPAAAEPERAVVTLSGLAQSWRAVSSVKPRSAEEASYAVKSLVAFLGFDDAVRLTRADLQRWRDALKAAGNTNATWNNRLSHIRQPLLFGVSEGLLRSDPTKELRLPKGRAQSPLPFTDAEAVQILLAARQADRPSIRWAPWVMAFSGMRVAEVLQLTGGDVRAEGGTWFLSINEEHASKSVKTGQTRNVPLHPAVIAEGFLEFAAKVKGDAPLFPDKQVDRHGNRGGRAWQVVGRWVRETVGITDPRKAPDHSWRHRVEDELRSAAVAEDVRDAVLGHARMTTGRVYGVRGEALTRLAEAVGKIPVPAGLLSSGGGDGWE
jgi:integrase